MNYLTQKETIFLQKLMDDYVLMSEKSFLSVLFFCKKIIDVNTFFYDDMDNVLLDIDEKIKFEIWALRFKR